MNFLRVDPAAEKLHVQEYLSSSWNDLYWDQSINQSDKSHTTCSSQVIQVDGIC